MHLCVVPLNCGNPKAKGCFELVTYKCKSIYGGQEGTMKQNNDMTSVRALVSCIAIQLSS